MCPVSVRQLHREFARAGADVMQTFTFYASDDKLENRGNQAQAKHTVSAKYIRSLREKLVSLKPKGSYLPVVCLWLNLFALEADELKKKISIYRVAI